MYHAPPWALCTAHAVVAGSSLACSISLILSRRNDGTLWNPWQQAESLVVHCRCGCSRRRRGQSRTSVTPWCSAQIAAAHRRALHAAPVLRIAATPAFGCCGLDTSCSCCLNIQLACMRCRCSTCATSCTGPWRRSSSMPWSGAPPQSTTPRGACHTMGCGRIVPRLIDTCRIAHAAHSVSRLHHVQRGRWLAQVCMTRTKTQHNMVRVRSCAVLLQVRAAACAGGRRCGAGPEEQDGEWRGRPRALQDAGFRACAYCRPREEGPA